MTAFFYCQRISIKLSPYYINQLKSEFRKFAPMFFRKGISFILMFCYAGAIAHSIVPHHHHTDHQEAVEHHHQTDHHHSHQEGGHQENDPSSQPSTFFYSHSANADILLNHVSIDLNNKVKQADVAIFVPIICIYEHEPGTVFHPPQSDAILTPFSFSTDQLRAPPSLL